MTVDTKSMRQLLETTPGERVAMMKADMAKLLDVVDAGQTAALALANLSRILPPVAIAA